MLFSQFLENDLKNQLKSAAIKQLEEFPDPDYGQLFWSPSKKAVHWIYGDAAGGYSEAEERFSKIPGVEKVIAADEGGPPSDEDWEKISFREDIDYDQGLRRPQTYRPPTEIMKIKSKADKQFGRNGVIPKDRKRRKEVLG